MNRNSILVVTLQFLSISLYHDYNNIKQYYYIIKYNNTSI